MKRHVILLLAVCLPAELLKLQLTQQITCYSCSYDIMECSYINESTPTCKTHHGCIHFVEAPDKVSRHCFIPMPDQNLTEPWQFCGLLHQSFVDCRACHTDYCNGHELPMFFNPVIFQRKDEPQTGDDLKSEGNDSKKDASKSSPYRANPLPAVLLLCGLNL